LNHCSRREEELFVQIPGLKRTNSAKTASMTNKSTLDPWRKRLRNWTFQKVSPKKEKVSS